MSCKHERKKRIETDVLIEGSWELFSVQETCLDCDGYIKKGGTSHTYFLGLEDNEYRDRVVRDDSE